MAGLDITGIGEGLRALKARAAVGAIEREAMQAAVNRMAAEKALQQEAIAAAKRAEAEALARAEAEAAERMAAEEGKKPPIKPRPLSVQISAVSRDIQGLEHLIKDVQEEVRCGEMSPAEADATIQGIRSEIARLQARMRGLLSQCPPMFP
jgi:hypothetical protein